MKRATPTASVAPDTRQAEDEEARTRQARTAQALKFLRLLWGPTPPAGWFVTWWKDLGPMSGSASRPASDLAAASSHSVQLADLPTSPGMPNVHEFLGKEVYFACALQAKEPEWGSRGTASGACAIPGLWADLDVAGPAHKSTALPPTKEAASDLARRAPWPPTVLVDSGNGLQAWWLFPEPMLLADEADRKRAADLVARLQNHLRQNPEGWEVDQTADLARVLRLPGTWNRKLQHRAERLRRCLKEARSDAQDLAGPPPKPTGSKWDPPPEELASRPERAEKAAREAEELAEELEALQAAGTAPRPVRVLEVTGERHTPEEWDAALPALTRGRSATEPAPGSARQAGTDEGEGASSPGRPSLEDRAIAYLRKLGQATAGEGGDILTTRAIWAVAVEFGLPESVARRILEDWDQGNRPPWRDTEKAAWEKKLSKVFGKAQGHPEFGRLAKEDRPLAAGAKVIPIRKRGQGEQTAGNTALSPDKKGRKARDEDDKKPTQAQVLLSLAASACSLFRTPEGEPHATFRTRGRQEAWPIQSRMFSSWLRLEFLEEEGRPVGADAVKQAIDTLEAKALHGEAVREVFVRVAPADGRIVLDLADPEGRAVVIGPDGWTVTATPPVAFRRPPDQEPLPVPSREGSWDVLRPLLNLDEEGWILFVGWLVGSLAPLSGFPVLLVEGVQGSAKSSLAKAARALVDPSKMDVQRPPSLEEDLHIRAANSRLLALDNLTNPPRWLSDTICTLATGGGFAVRQKYTNREEAIFRSVRPVILTGIEGLARGDDLADRAIFLTLRDIPEERRQAEEEWKAALEEARPRILGAICDALSGALYCRTRTEETPRRLPRMADFAALVLAAEKSGALPWEPGSFLEALAANRRDASEVGVERDFLASTLCAWMEQRGEAWEGTAQALLDNLHSFLAEDERARKKLPGAANSLGGKLRRIAPMLRSAGILYEPPEKDAAKKPGRNPRKHGLRPAPPPPAQDAGPESVSDLLGFETDGQFEEGVL